MKKILFVATVPEHFLYFHIPCFKMLRENGWEVHAACSECRDIPECDKLFELPISRNPADKANIKAYRRLKEIVGKNNYDIVHCHTPMGGALARLASRRARKNGARVFYTAHGFHFCSGAPLLNWILFMPAEWFFSRMTDELITINDEDFKLAKRLMRAENVRLIHGVGCDLERFRRPGVGEKERLREEFGFKAGDKIVFYAAELNGNKNQGFLIEVINLLRKTEPRARLVLAGSDNMNGAYRKLAEDTGAPVDFLGVREDIPELMRACDVYAASSLREGLPLNIMEAMATGLPIVAVNNRGHRALVKDGETGFIIEPGDKESAAESLERLLTDAELYERFSLAARAAVTAYGKESVLRELSEAYGIL